MTFRKDGDLRWISHRDCLRLLERSLRRAGLRLSLSQGFHPKPRFSFPLALALGWEGHAEWMEVELQDDLSPDHVRDRLNANLPEGLRIERARRLQAGEARMQVDRLVYQARLPRERLVELQQAASHLLRMDHFPVPSAKNPGIMKDVRAGLLDLRWDEDELTIELSSQAPAGIGPREILAALGFKDAELAGTVIARQGVILREPDRATDDVRTPAHEKIMTTHSDMETS